MRLPILHLLLTSVVLFGCSDDPGVTTGSTRNPAGDGVLNDGGGGPPTASSGGDPGSGGGMSGFEPTTKPYRVDATGMAGLDAATLDALRAGGPTCTTPLLYPYEGTVLPGGLLPPLLMWQASSSAAYVKVSYDGSDVVQYEFAVATSDPGELRIPAQDWYEITRRTTGAPLRFKLSAKTAANISTCNLTLRVAAGNMVGSVYYNTYNLPELDGVGAVMRLTLGVAQAEPYLTTQGVAPTGPCVSCHSVSANGSVIAASTHLYGLLGTASYEVSAYDAQGSSTPGVIGKLPNAAYAALTPDGTKVLTMGNPECTAGADTFPRASHNFPFVEGTTARALRDVRSGADLRAKFPVGFTGYMWMPQFSPDGKRIVFNHAKPDSKGGTDRRELAMLDFDDSTNTFSNLKVLVSNEGPAPTLKYAPNTAGFGFIVVPAGPERCGQPDPNAFLGPTGSLDRGTCTGPCYPAWPFFTPDGRGVVFALTSEPDFLWALPGRETPAKSELWYVDTQTGKRVRLDRANAALPQESKLINYYPTVLPVQVGGYFWMFWTSTREFGHRASGASPSPIAEAGKGKRLWVSALRPVTGSGELTDPSAPGFYLEGQGDTGNTRAFASLNPCKPTGTACASGLDCCGGYCRKEAGATMGTCVDEAPKCAGLDEKCTKDADCCSPDQANEPERVCFGGYCGFVAIVQ